MLADCQSKTFTNARNECKESADFMRGKMSIFMIWTCVDAQEGSQHGTGRCGSQRGSKVYRGSSLNLSLSFFPKEIGLIHHSSTMVKLCR